MKRVVHEGTRRDTKKRESLVFLNAGARFRDVRSNRKNAERESTRISRILTNQTIAFFASYSSEFVLDSCKFVFLLFGMATDIQYRWTLFVFSSSWPFVPLRGQTFFPKAAAKAA
jgi:hypothetical protein